MPHVKEDKTESNEDKKTPQVLLSFLLLVSGFLVVFYQLVWKKSKKQQVFFFYFRSDWFSEYVQWTIHWKGAALISRWKAELYHFRLKQLTSKKSEEIKNVVDMKSDFIASN